jgi:hypothetical protein
MKLYRTVSKAERDDYIHTGQLNTAKNTLEGKQFFKSDVAVREFISNSRLQRYSPPYKYLLVIDIDEESLESIDYDEQELDRFEAITIFEADLPRFNNCINFIEQDAI